MRPLPPTQFSVPGHPDFAGFDYAAAQLTHPVYWKGPANQPGILVLHELPGLAQHTLNLADRLVAANYRVFLPHLFGTIMKDSAISSMKNYRALCVSAEFAKLEANATAPVTVWLRALLNDISAWCNDGPVGAIGMCLTGGFVIPLMLEPRLAAPVTCQPAIPIAYPIISAREVRAQINVADADLAMAAARAQRDGVDLIGVRFTSDWKCRGERFTRLQNVFRGQFKAHEYKSPDQGPGWKVKKGAHSVLTEEYDASQNEDHPSHRAMREVLALFERTLR